MSKLDDNSLKHDVENELEFDPAVDATKIGVTATDGVVMLTGNVHSYSEKWDSEKIAKRVYGVKGVANDLEVVLEGDAHRDDGDIARSALSALTWNFSIPKDKIKVSVSKGWLSLEGEVEWQYQRRAASDAVRNLRGVRGVTNDVIVRPRLQAADVKQKIEAALKRSAEVDSKHIKVQAVDSTVTLTGYVRTWVERDDAVNAAWSAPGVTKVVDRIALEA
jgi:osmotically-inducible protein OsmY